MYNAVHRGPALARAFRTCAPRVLQSARVASPLTANLQKALPLTLSSLRQVRSFQSALLKQANAAAAETQPQESFSSISEFSQLSHHGHVHPRIIHSITERMNINTMTDVQKLTIAHSVTGADVLAQAKTGTGKTLAFLVPVLQRIITNDPSLVQRSRGRFDGPDSQDIRAIIISPTRELAEQISVEARKVAAGTGVVVQTAVGGTRKQEGLNRIRREGCHVLVATPGRLKDILSDYRSRVAAPNLDILVLDEADRLLDDGFGPEIESIKDLLPDPSVRDRQTLMFSATVPREVMGMVRRSMKPKFQFIKTVSEDEVPTHLRVPQKMVFLRGFENGYPTIVEILKRYMDRAAADQNLRPMKAIVYFNTTVEVQLAHEAFGALLSDPMQRRSGNPLGRKILHIHSKLSQAQRTHFSDAFRRAESGILISSDVTARGLDFPDVTHVIQVGIPRNRESYIHRLGRTGRAGKEGQGWVLIHDEEERSFVEQLGDLPIEQDNSIEAANADMSKPDSLSGPVAETISQVTAALKLVPYEVKEDAYRIQLSANSSTFGRKRNLVAALNDLAKNGWGLPEPPAVSPSMASKLGYDRVPGLRMEERRSSRGRYDDAASSGTPSGAQWRFERPRRDGFASRRQQGFQRPERDDWFSMDRARGRRD
ncbi:DEAD box RNA helicase HelA, putative [Talaromyces stipitatus ATCC 10500]|uniref:ATP-dependent RNA helicase n=1 Tax=Talaromyces stipitatus (strain ATCC 10500 / CBS 375.48 / QM 6759 / NRRL 1006) TaxID=441959 RepID=B8M3A9_TALSN|nr:DEAD box RNA helicase HelA, putative [Talaromyces stipitatus ATCC 10500]EED22281.1 DEAD box RNA helicase HelA, putative [Talaromyces stipitatus ATCC 10500]